MGDFHFGFIAYYRVCLSYADVEFLSHYSFHLDELY